MMEKESAGNFAHCAPNQLHAYHVPLLSERTKSPGEAPSGTPKKIKAPGRMEREAT
jgi:hypothetical protein